MPNLSVTFMITFILFGTINKHLNKWVFLKMLINGKKMYILCKPFKIALTLNISFQHGQNKRYFLEWMMILISLVKHLKKLSSLGKQHHMDKLVP